MYVICPSSLGWMLLGYLLLLVIGSGSGNLCLLSLIGFVFFLMFSFFVLFFFFFFFLVIVCDVVGKCVCVFYAVTLVCGHV
jgi:hypothetical protein